LLGIFAMTTTFLLTGKLSFQVIYIGLTATILATIIQTPLTTFTTVWLFNKGHDPDNIMGPYNTTIGDIISIFCLVITILVIT